MRISGRCFRLMREEAPPGTDACSSLPGQACQELCRLPATEKGEMMENLKRGFFWEDIDAYHAILHGPEPYMITAVAEMVPDADETHNGEWRVISASYARLNLTERDIGIPLEQIKRRVVIELGNQIKETRRILEEDFNNVLSLLYEGEADGPYEY